MTKQPPQGELTRLRRQVELLTRRLRSSQSAALFAVSQLRRALGPEMIERNEVDETAYGQIERADRVMRAVMAQLARIIDPDALSQDQAEQTVGRLEQAGPRVDAAVWKEREENSMYGPRGLLVMLRRLVSALYLHHALDRCRCAEMGGWRCLFCTTTDALDRGERWLGLLDLERKSAVLPQDETAWERLWYFEDLDFVHLVAEVQRAACVYGQYIVGGRGEKTLPLAPAEPSADLEGHVQRVLAPFVWRQERAGGAEGATPFLKPYIAHWILQGHRQGRSTAALSGLEQRVQLQVLHAGAPDLDWGTTQAALQVSILLPDLLLHILSDLAFTDLSWSSGGVRYRLTRAVSVPAPIV
jgi:hypothetical protein